MKLYTTASNAKRAAKALAQKHDNLDVADKMEPGEEGHGFYATVHVNMGIESADVRKEAKVVPPPTAKFDEHKAELDLLDKQERPTDATTESVKPELLPLTDKDGKVGAVLDLNPNAGKPSASDTNKPTTKRIGGIPEGDKPAKDNKTTKALAMMSAKDGARAEDLLKALGWQKHTLRGFVSLQNSKQKRGISTIRKDGVTYYKVG